MAVGRDEIFPMYLVPSRGQYRLENVFRGKDKSTLEVSA